MLKAQITVTLQASEDAAIGYHDGSNTSANNYGGAIQSAAFKIPAAADPNGFNGNRALIKFNLISLPPGAAILSASLNLYALGPFGAWPGHFGNANACCLQRITQSWGEYTVTWNNQPPSSTQNQVLLPQSVSAVQDYLNINVTQLVLDMWNNPSTGHGFLLRLLQENASNGLCFASRDHSNFAKHPTLVITYKKCDPALTVNNPTVCTNGSATLQVNAVAGFSYTWQPAGAGASSLVVKPPATSVYTLVASDGKGCRTEQTATVTVLEITKPLVSFSYAGPFCTNAIDPVPAADAGFQPGGSYASQQGLVLDAASGSIDLAASQPGSYQVTYSLPAFQCSLSAFHTAQVQIAQAPLLTLPASLLAEPGESILLPASGNSTFTWSPAEELSCVNCAQPLASPPSSTRYCVLSANAMCTSRACVDVMVSCEGPYDHSVPNAFSPNGDGLNDEFCLRGWDFCTRSFEALILDRWGELVYQTHDPFFCWNGTYKGRPLQADVYVYSFRVTLKDGTAKHKKGSITLTR